MRLIDADLLLENIVHLNNVYVQGRMAYIIDNQPTAYDVETVVAELEEGCNEFYSMAKHNKENPYNEGVLEGYKRTLKIVRNGGRE